MATTQVTVTLILPVSKAAILQHNNCVRTSFNLYERPFRSAGGWQGCVLSASKLRSLTFDDLGLGRIHFAIGFHNPVSNVFQVAELSRCDSLSFLIKIIDSDINIKSLLLPPHPVSAMIDNKARLFVPLPMNPLHRHLDKDSSQVGFFLVSRIAY